MMIETQFSGGCFSIRNYLRICLLKIKNILDTEKLQFNNTITDFFVAILFKQIVFSTESMVVLSLKVNITQS